MSYILNSLRRTVARAAAIGFLSTACLAMVGCGPGAMGGLSLAARHVAAKRAFPMLAAPAPRRLDSSAR